MSLRTQTLRSLAALPLLAVALAAPLAGPRALPPTATATGSQAHLALPMIIGPGLCQEPRAAPRASRAAPASSARCRA